MRSHLCSARTLLLTLSLVSPILAMAQSSPDTHVTLDSARELYQSSSWAHGYVHGYEQGFHIGDLDVQLAKGARDPEKDESAKIRMRQVYGDLKNFSRVLKQGLLVGYADAYSGREFRAFRELRKLAQDFEPVTTSSNDQDGDRAIDEGYKKGLAAGLYDGRTGRKFTNRADVDPCKRDTGYCAFHDRGVQLGYADGYWNQNSPNEVRTARARN
jgi:hypothetical protein